MNWLISYFNKPILKVSLLFALATGVAAFAFFLGLYALGIPPLSTKRNLDMGVYVILIGSACWYYRKKYGNGFMHLWEGLTMGYIIVCIAAMINAWLIYFFITRIDASVFTDYINNALKVLEDGRKSQTAFLSEKEYNDLYLTVKNDKPSVIISNEITQRLLMSIIPILIISFVFRKQDRNAFPKKP